MDSTSTSPFVATSLYTAKYGAVGTVWKENFLRHEQVKLTTGQAGRKVECSTVIVT